jgi:threonine 3-dehydrogenase
MKILITGGTGFIGREVVRLLLERGADEIAIFHHSPDSPRRLKDIAAKIEWIQGDIGEVTHVMSAVEKARPDSIYHMSAMLSLPSDADPASAIQSNAMGTFYVLEAARLFNVKQVMFASSIGTYGYDISTPVIDDTTLQRPVLLYGATKVFGEHLGLFYRRKYGLDFRGIRYQQIIGPGVKTPGVTQFMSHVIEQSIKGNPFTIIAKPETRVPMLYIKDAAKATIQLAETPAERIKMVNYLINGHFPSAAEVADILCAKFPNAKIDFQPDMQVQAMLDAVLRPIDGKKAQAEWDWQPTYDLEQMIDDFASDLKQYPERYS